LDDSESDFIYQVKDSYNNPQKHFASTATDELLIRLPQEKNNPALPYLNEDHRKIEKPKIPNGRYLSN
jgi:hypothetical protein